MAAIHSEFGQGGRNLAPGGSNGKPWLAQVLRDIATDLAGLQGSAPGALTSSAPAALTSSAPAGLTSSAPAGLTSSTNGTAAAATQTGAYVQADAQSVATLANSLKTTVNQLVADVAALRTTIAAAVVDLGVLRTPVVALVTDAGNLRTTLAAVVVDLAALRSKASTNQGYTLLTTAP